MQPTWRGPWSRTSTSLLAAGVPDLRLHTLADGYAELVQRIEVEPRFRDAVGRVRDLVDELASYAVVETLQHDDLHDGQVFVKDGRNLILDWGDAVVSHPFFTMSVTLEGGVAWGLDDVADSEDIWPYVDTYLARYAPDRPELRDAVPLGAAAGLGVPRAEQPRGQRRGAHAHAAADVPRRPTGVARGVRAVAW